MPLLGFGVFQVTDQEQCRQCASEALRVGYRMIDTAACYGNERAVGQALHESGLARKDAFLVSKVWVQDAGYDATMRSFEKTLANLGTSYLDLYLIHMPLGDYFGSWRAMRELQEQGAIRATGVCNFQEDRLLDLVLGSGFAPTVNQVELHPFCQQRTLRACMDQLGVAAMAWAPFDEARNNIFANPVLCKIAQAHGVTSSQVILRWLAQLGIAAIPKSVHSERIRANFVGDEFTLTDAEMAQIAALDQRRPDILDIRTEEEVQRLHGITFEQ